MKKSKRSKNIMSDNEENKTQIDEFPKFEGAVFFVNDMKISKSFYVDLLGQEVLVDFGRNVGFKGGFSIWEKDYALKTIFEKEAEMIKVGSNNAELYFEHVDIDKLFQKLKDEGIDIIHSIREHPWGQRGFRFRDPDNHIVEVSESMFNVIARMYQEGMNLKQIEKKSLMPTEFIKMVINNLEK